MAIAVFEQRVLDYAHEIADGRRSQSGICWASLILKKSTKRIAARKQSAVSIFTPATVLNQQKLSAAFKAAKLKA